MRVCDQFTDERNARFFWPINHEMEVHSSVDLSNAPGAVYLDVDEPMAIIENNNTGRLRAQSPKYSGFRDGVSLAQGDRITGLLTQLEKDDQLRAGQYFGYIDETEEVERLQTTDAFVIDSLKDITHMIVTVDYMIAPSGASLDDSPFAGPSRSAVLPIDEPIPEVHKKFEKREAFKVGGLVNSAGQFVNWRNAGASGPNPIVDYCILNAYMHNRIEHSILRNAIGHGYVLKGLVSTNEATQAYLAHFDSRFGNNVRANGGMTFSPNNEPMAHGHVDRFPRLTRSEQRLLERLQLVAHRAMTEPDRSKLK